MEEEERPSLAELGWQYAARMAAEQKLEVEEMVEEEEHLELNTYRSTLAREIQDYLNQQQYCPGHHHGPCINYMFIEDPNDKTRQMVYGQILDRYPSCPLWVAERNGMLQVLNVISGRLSSADTFEVT